MNNKDTSSDSNKKGGESEDYIEDDQAFQDEFDNNYFKDKNNYKDVNGTSEPFLSAEALAFILESSQGNF